MQKLAIGHCYLWYDYEQVENKIILLLKIVGGALRRRPIDKYADEVNVKIVGIIKGESDFTMGQAYIIYTHPFVLDEKKSIKLVFEN